MDVIISVTISSPVEKSSSLEVVHVGSQTRNSPGRSGNLKERGRGGGGLTIPRIWKACGI